MTLNFTELLWLIIAVSIAVIAIKITISFDINEFLKSKSQRLLMKAKNVCPHARFMKSHDGKHGIQSNFVSPSGTTNYICTTCQLIVYKINDEDLRIRYFLENPNELNRKIKKFEKLIKKAGLS